MSSRVTVDILDGTAGIASVRDEWQALYEQRGRELSLSYAWSHAVAAVHAAPGDRLRTIALRRDGVLIGVLPLLARPTRRGFRHLMPLAEQYNTHSDWLAAETSDAIADGFVDGLVAAGLGWDRFRMSRVLEHNPLLPHVIAALGRRGLRFVLRTEPSSYVLRLPTTYRDYLAGRSAKFRNHLKRVEKKIQARRWEVTVLTGPLPADGFMTAFAQILAIEGASWKQAHDWPMSPESAQTEFWRQVCQSAWDEGRMHAQFLTVDGTPAAYNLGYIVGDEYSYLKTTFGRDFKEIGAATFLRGHLIDDLITRGIRMVDFPGYPYDWERQWTDELRGHVMLTAYSGSARSRVLEAFERARHRHYTRHETASDLRGAATTSL